MLSHEIKARIETGLSHSRCYVNEFSGTNDHYSVIVIASAFHEKTLIARHRIVMDLFKEEIKTEEVHALSIKALTPQQWEQEPLSLIGFV